MSDPQVPERDDQPADVNDVVDSANESLAEAEAAGRSPQNSSTFDERSTFDEPTPESGSSDDALAVESARDADLAAFEAAEREHPGTFADAPPPVAPAEPVFTDSAAAASDPVVESSDPVAVASDPVVPPATTEPAAEPEVVRAEVTETEVVAAEPAASDVDFTPPASGTAAAATQVYPSEPVYAPASEPVYAPAPEPVPQPIFVQAPEAPRPIGNRALAGLIGLVATVVFAVLYLGAKLAAAAIAGDVTLSNIGTVTLDYLQTWGFWLPVVFFFIGFWLLGAIINRGRWWGWVIFGLVVGLFAYGGHILGVLFEAPFWMLTASQGAELAREELLAPLAIAAFVFGREITIWFGAWVARAGARKNELNAEAMREYERTLEAGPTLAR